MSPTQRATATPTPAEMPIMAPSERESGVEADDDVDESAAGDGEGQLGVPIAKSSNEGLLYTVCAATRDVLVMLEGITDDRTLTGSTVVMTSPAFTLRGTVTLMPFCTPAEALMHVASSRPL